MKKHPLTGLFRYFLIASLLASLWVTTGVSAPPLKAQAAPIPSNSQSQGLAAAEKAVFPPITIPVTGGTPKIDGLCDKGEYSSASTNSFTDGPAGGSATVFLMHNATDLYVCLLAPAGSNQSRFASLYIDPQGNGISYQFAQQDDFSLRVNIPALSGTGYQGSGIANGYVRDTDIDSFWEGVATTDGNIDQVEYRVNLKDFGLTACSDVFGLAVYHHWFTGTGNDYGWPSAQWYDQPGTWQLVANGGTGCGKSGKIAYVYKTNALDAMSFYNFLAGAGYAVDLVPLGSVLATDFSVYDLILIANDTGSLDQWGTPGLTSDQVNKIAYPTLVKPIIGLGEGGYAFFGRLSMYTGWPRGWHGPQSSLRRASLAVGSFFSGVSTADPVPTYSAPTNSVGIYLPPNTAVPTNVTPVGMEDPPDDHAGLIQEGCDLLWGNSGNPLGMTADGQTIFLNSVGILEKNQCATPPVTPPQTCYTIQKDAVPIAGTAVTPGTTITYTITYQLLQVVGANCQNTAKLVDVIPFGTNYVPGSASDGIAPGGDGVLTWLVNSSDSTPTKTFKVTVTDNVCTANQVVTNVAELHFSGIPPISSTAVTHPVTCPPVGLPSNQPIFAESELKVEPYPLVAGVTTKVSVQVDNLTALSQPVTVAFQTSPAGLGIGLAYTTFATVSTTLAASTPAVLVGYFVPSAAGNACVQVQVSAPGYAPLVTQSCLDVTENLSLGIPANLTVPVRNNTGATADVILVVDNTCPGWSASITNPPGGVLMGVTAGETRSVTMTVTPPATGLLGTGCHIDLQAWIGTTMIGGVRKLDIAPVHLPLTIQPPWEEAEITVQPDPANPGIPSHLCIQLVNPLATSRSVTVHFSVADFGAGVGFTPAVSQTFNLPANSVGTYCVDWTPTTGGTLHRCILATLSQDGYVDQHSQRNIELVQPPAGSGLSGLAIPFMVHNPDLMAHDLAFHIDLVGINPFWMPVIGPVGGGGFPMSLLPGSQILLQLAFPSMAAIQGQVIPPPNYTFGSESSVQVTMLLDGVPSGGFTIQIGPRKIFLPILKK